MAHHKPDDSDQACLLTADNTRNLGTRNDGFIDDTPMSPQFNQPSNNGPSAPYQYPNQHSQRNNATDNHVSIWDCQGLYCTYCWLGYFGCTSPFVWYAFARALQMPSKTKIIIVLLCVMLIPMLVRFIIIFVGVIQLESGTNQGAAVGTEVGIMELIELIGVVACFVIMFNIKREFDIQFQTNETDCSRCATLFFCHPCVAGQIGKTLKNHQIQVFDV